MTTNQFPAKTTLTCLLFLAAASLNPQQSGAAIPGAIITNWYEPAGADTTHRFSGRSNHVHTQNGTTTNISHEGKISFTADEKDIKSISPGGFFEYSKITFGNSRTLRIEGGSDGKLTRKYRVGNKETAYEPEGRQFLADVLPDVLRSSTLGADDRIARMYEKNGAKGVLSEVRNIDSDYVKSYYLCTLLRKPGLKPNELAEVLQTVNTSLSSDYEKGKVLSSFSKLMPDNEKVVGEYVNVAGGMGSDYEKGKALALVVNNPKLGAASFTQAMTAIGKMGSDYEKSKLLIQAIENKNTSDANLKRLLEAATTIRSDYELSKVLIRFSDSRKVSGEMISTTLAGTKGISSDYEKGKVLCHLVSNQTLTPAQLVQCTESAVSIGSDYEKGKVLRQISSRNSGGNAQVKEALRKAAKTINSEYEYGKVMKAID